MVRPKLALDYIKIPERFLRDLRSGMNEKIWINAEASEYITHIFSTV